MYQTELANFGSFEALDYLPTLGAGDPTSAPLLRVTATAVIRPGWSWTRFLTAGGLGIDRPEFVTSMHGGAKPATGFRKWAM